jgi:hypothetical protein
VLPRERGNEALCEFLGPPTLKRVYVGRPIILTKGLRLRNRDQGTGAPDRAIQTKKLVRIPPVPWPREQVTHKPLVGGSNPSSATFTNSIAVPKAKRPAFSGRFILPSLTPTVRPTAPLLLPCYGIDFTLRQCYRKSICLLTHTPDARPPGRRQPRKPMRERARGLGIIQLHVHGGRPGQAQVAAAGSAAVVRILRHDANGRREPPGWSVAQVLTAHSELAGRRVSGARPTACVVSGVNSLHRPGAPFLRIGGRSPRSR